MRWVVLLSCLIAAAAGAGERGVPSKKAGYPVQAVAPASVQLNDGFWAPRLEINRAQTLPHIRKELEQTGRISNFVDAGEVNRGETVTGKFQGLVFNDSDVYKYLEAASLELALKPDPGLEKSTDELIGIVAAAQEKDGYLYTTRTAGAKQSPPVVRAERWSDMMWGHELYCAGHLYEAAAAHYAATKKRSLLDVALKNADLVCSVFAPGKKTIPCGHPEVEIGLVKLYRATGERKYLDQARFFIDLRGKPEGRGSYGEYAQDHLPFVKQTEAVGHSVRAAYLFAGAADVAAYGPEPQYLSAVDKLWESVAGSKVYITGGIGSRGGGEAFGDPYELPNRTAYAETCAAIAYALWNQRMFQLHGESKYADELERVLYNGFLAGVQLDGCRFFYPNPLESRGENRSPWFDCACCPPNVARMFPQIPGMQYATQDDSIFVNLYARGTAEIPLGKRHLKLVQETRYPWSGDVKLTIASPKPGRFALKLRVPSWAREGGSQQALYSFATPISKPPALFVAGKALPMRVENGYAIVSRSWKQGDVVELKLPMPVRRVRAIRVPADSGKVAFQRGPLIYCAEGQDNVEGRVLSLVDADKKIEPVQAPDLLGGIVELTTEARVARRVIEASKPRVEASGSRTLTLIPYYAWANRGPGEMAVWIAADPNAARPLPAPTLAYTSKVRTSGGTGREALNDQLEPKSSIDHDNPFFHWWPKKGTLEWLEYEFPKATRVSGVEVYWFDDTGIGECRLPKSWKLLAKVDGQWREVSNPSAYGVEKDRYNRVSFDPVQAEALRIEVQLPERFSAGVHEWRIIE